MGWFDNEQQEGKPAAPAPQSPSTPARPASSNNPAPPAESGSTLGRKIHIDGTIVCEEDLTILGHVDGTIRAKGTLVIAKDADVRAKIDGQRVMVHGKVNGDVQGEERVVLGETARLMGNIETPRLEIIEGAHFKGNVDMQTAKKEEPAKVPAPAPAAAKPKAKDDKPDAAPAAKSSGGDAKKEEPSAAQKQATT